jgi:hypothetical protein
MSTDYKRCITCTRWHSRDGSYCEDCQRRLDAYYAVQTFPPLKDGHYCTTGKVEPGKSCGHCL